MTARSVAFIGAASNIGIRPYDRGEPRHIDRAPSAFRELRIVERLLADDLGDVLPPPYADFVRPPGRPRNEQGVADYSRSLGERVEAGLAGGRFVLVAGGDCSVVLGCLLGARRARGRVGLVYVDAHADFAAPEESQTGSVASMCLALAVGRGDSALARLSAPAPLVRATDVALVGRRDMAEPSYGHEALRRSGVLDVLDEGLWADGIAGATTAVLARMGAEGVSGFWVHVDADVLTPGVMPAVDSPEPGGPGFTELAELLAPLVNHPRALGLQVTLYDPSLDPDRSAGEGLVAMLERVLVPRAEGANR